jgi:protein Tex
MEKYHIEKIADELKVKHWQVEATASLLTEGATVPFVARYRKEATGSLDEVAIASVRDRLSQLEELDKRREAIFKSLTDQGKLTDELKEKIAQTETMAVLEDIYLPFRPKRRTKATIARERGLEPLAQRLFIQDSDMGPEAGASSFVDPENGVLTVTDALSGARDIIAEWINEDQDARTAMRKYFSEKGVFISKVVSGKESDGAKYRDYFDLQEPVATAPSHRILAMRRGEKEGFLSLYVGPADVEQACALLEARFVKGTSPSSLQVKMAVEDSYKRLLSHSMETEIRLETKKRADEEAIRIFGNNVRQLLMAPPMGQKMVMAIDPGFRTGCKLVCLDPQGKLIHTDTIYPLLSEKARAASSEKVQDLCSRFNVEAIAIGNGTGGRETKTFIEGLSLPEKINVIMVNESGASVYSASEAGREEFPDHDVTVRGAVSIGRRLMDPLAELVKIDPRSIGVGQYQHDVDQKALGMRLDDIVISCVNAVGVEVNTASRQLLTYVSGLGTQLAQNIVSYRDEHGPFTTRQAIKQVPRLGAKAFEQAAGFLRIFAGDNPLDASAVHPESYPIVEAMAKDLNCTVEALMRDGDLRKEIQKENYVTDTVGIPTLNDILQELAKPGRDPRQEFESVTFAEEITAIGDLKIGMELTGVVTNITAFGVFVDVGVHQDGMVHISRLANHFVKDPNDVVKVNQKVKVTVLDVDIDRNRVSLSMTGANGQLERTQRPVTKTRPAVKAVSKGNKPRQDLFNNPFARAFKDR